MELEISMDPPDLKTWESWVGKKTICPHLYYIHCPPQHVKPEGNPLCLQFTNLRAQSPVSWRRDEEEEEDLNEEKLNDSVDILYSYARLTTPAKDSK